MYSMIYSLGVIGAPQIILIVVVVLLLFGGRKIPELMKGLGSGIKEFKKAVLISLYFNTIVFDELIK